MKGKLKKGQYETSLKMEIPGMPAGGINNTFRNCVTKEDLEKGKGDLFSDPNSRKNDTSCVIRNVKSSGNTISYDMDCAATACSPPTPLRLPTAT
jgi:hypothetical protein